MSKPLGKPRNRRLRPSCLIVLFTISLGTAGFAQAEKKLPDNSVRESDSNVEAAPALRDQAPMDHLFFLEGQLCAWVRNIFQDTRGNLWFATNHYGVMRYDGDTLMYFTANEGLGYGRVTEIAEDKGGNIWFGTAEGLTKYDGKSFTNFPLKKGPFYNDIWSITIDYNGLFWIGTLDGVFQFDGEKFTPFPIPKAEVSDTSSILSYDRVVCIAIDKKGALWFGTDGFGICRYNPSAAQKGEMAFSHFTTKDGLCDNNILDIMEDAAGNIWIGTMFGGISRFDGTAFTNFTKDGVISGEEAGGFFEDSGGNIWFAAENHGVYRYDGRAFTHFYEEAGLQTNGILSIFEDKESRFWLGGWGGLFRYDGASFIPVTKQGPWAK